MLVRQHNIGPLLMATHMAINSRVSKRTVRKILEKAGFESGFRPF